MYIMVYSNINSTVFYKESPDIDPEDIDYEALIYELDIHRKQILVVLGKAKHTFIQRNIIIGLVDLDVLLDPRS